MMDNLSQASMERKCLDKGQNIGLKRIRVAVAEDVVLLRSLIVYYLSRENDIDVVFDCGSGSEIVEYCKKHEVDVLVMDVSMSEMNGIDASVVIKKVFPGVRIILMTGFPELKAVSSASGADFCIDKSVNPRDLVALVRQNYAMNNLNGHSGHRQKINTHPVASYLGLNDVESLVLDRLVNYNMNTEELRESICYVYPMTVSNVKRIISKIMTLMKVKVRNRQSILDYCMGFSN